LPGRDFVVCVCGVVHCCIGCFKVVGCVVLCCVKL
jgi:hypothetical protein